MKKHGCLWWLFIGWWLQLIKGAPGNAPEPTSAPEIVPAQQSSIPQSPAPQATEPKNAQPAEQTKIKTYRATGMNHRMESLLSLGLKNDDYCKTKKELIENDLTEQRVYEYEFYPHKTELVPEPDNPHDPNAIMVVVDGVHIAYVKAGSCAHLLKVIKADRIKNIKCEIKGGKYKYISCDYDDEKDRETYTLESSEASYSVVLHVTEE